MNGIAEFRGKDQLFGFSSVQDWFLSVLLSFPAPWSIAPLDGKYYGTVILDSRAIPILSFWKSEGEPSVREKSEFRDWTPEAWGEYCCDSHWESEICLTLVQDVVAARNSFEERLFPPAMGVFIATVFMDGDFHERAWKELTEGGGPNRRIMPWEKAMPADLKSMMFRNVSRKEKYGF